MKRILFFVAAVALIISGCTGNTSKQETEAESQEIMKADSLSNVIDSLKEELDAAVRELDTLMKEL